MVQSKDNSHQSTDRRHGSGLPICAKAAANYLDMHVKTLQKKTREGKIMGFTSDDGPRRHWYYYIADLDDYRHKNCSQPANLRAARIEKPASVKASQHTLEVIP